MRFLKNVMAASKSLEIWIEPVTSSDRQWRGKRTRWPVDRATIVEERTDVPGAAAQPGKRLPVLLLVQRLALVRARHGGIPLPRCGAPRRRTAPAATPPLGPTSGTFRDLTYRFLFREKFSHIITIQLKNHLKNNFEFDNNCGSSRFLPPKLARELHETHRQSSLLPAHCFTHGGFFSMCFSGQPASRRPRPRVDDDQHRVQLAAGLRYQSAGALQRRSLPDDQDALVGSCHGQPTVRTDRIWRTGESHSLKENRRRRPRLPKGGAIDEITENV